MYCRARLKRQVDTTLYGIHPRVPVFFIPGSSPRISRDRFPALLPPVQLRRVPLPEVVEGVHPAAEVAAEAGADGKGEVGNAVA